MLERLLMTLVLLVGGVIAYREVVRWQMRRAVMQAVPTGIPTIMYFTTATCGPCKTTVSPALDRLQSELGDGGVRIIRVDAEHQPDEAARWGVLTVPTLFVLDGNGNPTRVYNGVTSADSLRRDLLATRTA
jgi:thiol-disulfide isomerase/thioredoxin